LINYILCKTALSRSKLPGLNYTFNPYFGCQHGCLYCYVPDVLKINNMEWGKFIFVKKNILDILKREVTRKKIGTVGISTSTDPYQPIEKDLEITRKALVILINAGFPISIQTKSSLVLRDIDILINKNIDVGLTITSTDSYFQKIFEPNAPPPDERIATLEELSDKGIKTWIFYGPIIPNYNDSEEEIEKIVKIALKTKSKIIYDKLNLKPNVIKRLNSNNINYNGDYNKIFSKIEFICKKYDVKYECAFQYA
jgi:DNA repair photolyase